MIPLSQCERNNLGCIAQREFRRKIWVFPMLTPIVVPMYRVVTFYTFQWVIGVILNFAVPVTFFLILSLSDGPQPFMSPNTLSTIFMSPLLTGILAPMFLPLAIVPAIDKKWLRPIRLTGTPRLPLYWRPGWSLFRHGIAGIVLTTLLSPTAFMIAIVLSPMSGVVFALFMATFIAICAACVIPYAIAIFCIDKNLVYMQQLFAGRPLPMRLLLCIKC